ncbi:recombination protein RecT [Prescottella equi]|uniref:recombination protein RecT n=1 Tax=Rhodococcus hoagii TaxID=43767 RepID=UPI001EE9E213|nr:recombination protein RecT [Prescottella equi]
MATNLAERVAANATSAPATTTGNAPAVQQNKPATLQDSIRNMEKQFQLAMPKGAEATQLVRDALTSIRQTPKLAQCDSASVLGALMTCAQLGLRPGVLGHAWVLPYWDKKAPRPDGRGEGAYKAQLIIGYQGLVDLAYRSNKIAAISARTIFANDAYEVEYGLEDKLIHKPLMTGDRGEPVAYYAVVKLDNGGSTFVVISHADMLKYRNKHASAQKDGVVFGPWRDNFEGMAHKTCLRQLSKWMPKSTALALAVENDGAVRVDLTPTAVEHPQHIEGEVVEASEEPPVAEEASRA